MALVVTDAGRAFLKTPCSDEGPHAVAREWVVSNLARDFGLDVPDCALLELTDDDAEVWIYKQQKRRTARLDWVFASRCLDGASQWGGSSGELSRLLNPEAISRLVVFDTWVRNVDRHSRDHPDFRGWTNYGNVLLVAERAKRGYARRLIALDHTHCCPCPKPGATLKPSITAVSHVQDDNLYGLFPAFAEPGLIRQADVEEAVGALRAVDADRIRDHIESVPRTWELSGETRKAWEEFFVARARYVVDKILVRLRHECWPGRIYDNRFGLERDQ